MKVHKGLFWTILSKKLNHLEEIDKLLEKYNLPKLNQEEVESLKRVITKNEIEEVSKNLPTMKKSGSEGSTAKFNQIF
jgi:hypothetical protein